MKHAVIAGFGPGMGAAVARRFAAEGFALSLLARGRDKLDEAVAGFRAQGRRADGVAVDLADPRATGEALASILATSGPADVMVYNGARWRQAPSMSLPPWEFGRDLDLAVTGALVSAQAIYPSMRERRSGTMLFTGGGLALDPGAGAGVASLTAGKAGLRGLVHALAAELAPDGIHVATVTIAGPVAPGTRFDPDLIAGHYWDLHRQPRESWEVERVFRG